LFDEQKLMPVLCPNGFAACDGLMVFEIFCPQLRRLKHASAHFAQDCLFHKV
jgi:hypothetical protein